MFNVRARHSLSAPAHCFDLAIIHVDHHAIRYDNTRPQLVTHSLKRQNFDDCSGPMILPGLPKLIADNNCEAVCVHT